jgi:UDP-3-O-[3-hydroxymyristoyl] N-acetylglucosamine deacetylase
LRRQTTIRREAVRSGIGLHSGRKVTLRLRPGGADLGIRFVRTDLGGMTIPASRDYLDQCNYATTLRRGEARVETVEHLLSALYGSGIDNIIAEMDGPEVPILDGSAIAFLELLREAGRRELPEDQRFLKVTRPVGIVEQGKEMVVVPADDLQVSYHIDFPHPAIGRQERTLRLTPGSFETEVAPARTFTFVRDVDALRQAGLAQGGSLTNAVVLDDRRLLNSTLRFPDEFVRHKLLDLIGDLALLGRPLLGHVMAFKAGHDLHGRLVTELLARTDCWTLVGSSLPSWAPAAPRPVAGAQGAS